ncbi:hypothetical protein [uncultured Paracoccus sp.]|uniref:hypothetical protein n=1 Tax=uncultured Paracoccus sp. TaxID=189685 RepID=UPI0026179A92|nr:hypothetical protein [uncultured Paracoccus sp.]
MITCKHLEDVSLELAHLEELMAALELVADQLVRGDDDLSRVAHDATIGVKNAMSRQIPALREALSNLFPIARDSEKGAR